MPFSLSSTTISRVNALHPQLRQGAETAMAAVTPSVSEPRSQAPLPPVQPSPVTSPPDLRQPLPPETPLPPEPKVESTKPNSSQAVVSAEAPSQEEGAYPNRPEWVDSLPGFLQGLFEKAPVPNKDLLIDGLNSQLNQVGQKGQHVSSKFDRWQQDVMGWSNSVSNKVQKMLPYQVEVRQTQNEISHKNAVELDSLSESNPLSYVMTDAVKNELYENLLNRQQAQIDGIIRELKLGDSEVWYLS